MLMPYLVRRCQVGEFLAVDRRFGDEDAPRYELAVERSPLFEGHVDDVAQKGGDGVGILRRADDQQLVADMQAAVLRGDGDMVVGVGDPRNDERAVDKLLHLAHRPAVEHGVGELDRYFVGVFLVFVAHRRQRLVLLLEADAQRIADEDHREDDADDAQRIGYGIAQCDRRVVDPRSVAVSLLCGAQSRRVGHGARQDADHGGDRRIGGQMQRIGGGDTQYDDERRQSDELHTAVLERREKPGPDLQPDRKDEQDQAELLDEAQHAGVDRHAEMAGCDADEENPRRPQRNASDLDFPQQDSDGDDQRQNENGVRQRIAEKEVVQPIHTVTRLTYDEFSTKVVLY